MSRIQETPATEIENQGKPAEGFSRDQLCGRSIAENRREWNLRGALIGVQLQDTIAGSRCLTVVPSTAMRETDVSAKTSHTPIPAPLHHLSRALSFFTWD
jgi:hypothetical protein